MGKSDKDKQAVVQCARWLSEHGFFGCVRGSGGNISLKVNDENRIAITPSMRPYRGMSMDDICVIDDTAKRIEGHLAPSLEASLHLAVYKHRPDVRAVIHSHSVFVSILSVINAPIPALFDEITFAIGASIDVVPYALSGSPQLADNVAGKLGNHCLCYILQNHGGLSLGTDMDHALQNTELLGKVAQIYYHALTSGRKIIPLPPDAIDAIHQLRTSR